MPKRDYHQNYSPIDRLIIGFAGALETLNNSPQSTSQTARPLPATSTDDDTLTAAERRQSGRYMRVNHVGEVCAQALYHSQAITAQTASTRAQMKQAAAEESDHLAWCEQRIEELGARKSLLNPLWYFGAFSIGTMAGMTGERWNLGFVAETERQVVTHLETHLGKLPQNDARSREIVTQMQQEEHEHAESAVRAGAAELPPPVKRMMRMAAKGMTMTAHWI